MKEMQTIQIQKRTNANSNANMRLRKTGYLPASVYGKGMETISISVKRDELRKLLTTLGRNAVFKLEVPGEPPLTAIVKEIQNAPLSREYLHVDFQQVSLSQEIHTDVAIKIIGADILDAKKLLLIRQTDMISVKGFPQDIPDSIEIDVSNLELGDSVKISDIKLSPQIVIGNDLEQVVISITEPRVHDSNDESNDNIEEE